MAQVQEARKRGPRASAEVTPPSFQQALRQERAGCDTLGFIAALVRSLFRPMSPVGSVDVKVCNEMLYWH